MKTRQGFVSNSSTSSFVLVGWELPLTDATDLEDTMKKLGHPVKAPIRKLIFDQNDKEGIDKAEGNYDAFNLVSYARYTSKEHTTTSVRLGLPYWGDSCSGVTLGKMLVGVEGDSYEGIDLADAMIRLEKIRTDLGIPETEKIKIFGGAAEQST